MNGRLPNSSGPAPRQESGSAWAQSTRQTLGVIDSIMSSKEPTTCGYCSSQLPADYFWVSWGHYCGADCASGYRRKMRGDIDGVPSGKVSPQSIRKAGRDEPSPKAGDGRAEKQEEAHQGQDRPGEDGLGDLQQGRFDFA